MIQWTDQCRRHMADKHGWTRRIHPDTNPAPVVFNRFKHKWSNKETIKVGLCKSTRNFSPRTPPPTPQFHDECFCGSKQAISPLITREAVLTLVERKERLMHLDSFISSGVIWSPTHRQFKYDQVRTLRRVGFVIYPWFIVLGVID